MAERKPLDFPEAFYLQAASNKQNNVYQVDSESSKILIHAQRGGVLALIDHTHLITSQNVQGYILVNKHSGECQADLFVPLNKLDVDDPQLRLENNLDTTSSMKKVANTKKKMLKNINADNSPFAQLYSGNCIGALSGEDTQVTLTINNVKKDRKLTIKMQQNSDDQLLINGDFSILQTNFGIKPFSIFNGLIKIKDKLDFTYQITFKKIN